KEISDYKNKIKNIESYSKQIDLLNRQIEELKKKNESNKSKILTKQKIVLVSDEIGRRAKEFNLDIRDIKPEKTALFSDSSSTGMISRMPFKLFIRGKFFDFGKFLETFDEFPFLIKAGPVSMSTDDDTYPELFIEAIVYVYFYKE
ncbi:hypothetical protein DRQ09_02080, partial [candidate division KSB1 bacterium]